MSMRWLALGLIGLTGCFPVAGEGGECVVDQDCGSGFSCTRTRECVDGTLIDARVRWTIAAAAASDASCAGAGIDHLSIAFADTATDDRTTYSPVPCPLGMATYDKMPPRFDTVSINAHDSSDSVLDSAVDGLQPGENLIDFDLMP
jgi:hypothetical protein